MAMVKIARENELTGLVKGRAFVRGEKVAEDEDQESGDRRGRSYLDHELDRVLGLLLGDAGGQCVECVDVLFGDSGVLIDDEVVLGIYPLDAGHAALRRVSEASGSPARQWSDWGPQRGLEVRVRLGPRRGRQLCDKFGCARSTRLV